MIYCKDAGQDRPGCLELADERYTMRFDDLGMPPIYWCAACGPSMHAVDKELMRRLQEEPGFVDKLASMLAEAEEETWT